MDMESLFAGLISADGTMQFERERPAVDAGTERWLPPYFTQEAQARVIDPTGGGNGFLGGLSSKSKLCCVHSLANCHSRTCA